MPADGNALTVQIDRSARAEVRNPIAACPEVAQRIRSLSPQTRAELAHILGDLSKIWREKAEKSWRTHKPPMAAYWKQNAVNARHLGLALRKVV